MPHEIQGGPRLNDVRSRWVLPFNKREKQQTQMSSGRLRTAADSTCLFSCSGNHLHIRAGRRADHVHVAAKRPSQHEGGPASHWLQHAPEGRRPGEGGQLLWPRRLPEASHRKSLPLFPFFFFFAPPNDRSSSTNSFN